MELRISEIAPHTRGARPRRIRRARPWRDHPRIRGEHDVAERVGRIVHGIIPAYAGSTAEAEAQQDEEWGSSPAFAGSTPSVVSDMRRMAGSSPHSLGAPTARSRARVTRGDHPRIRGEHADRGRPAQHRAGIIPACAGSTIWLPLTTVPKPGSSPHTRGAHNGALDLAPCGRDHPRIRGEHTMALLTSPHVAGIIPAYAGSTPPQ